MTKLKQCYEIAEPNKIPKYASITFIKRGSSTTRSILCFLKMRRGRPATAKQIKDVFFPFFNGPADVARLLDTLERRGFVELVYPGAWRITKDGIQAIYLLARRDKHIFAEIDKEDSR